MFRIQTEMKRYETCISLSFLNFCEKTIVLIWRQKYNVNLMQTGFVDKLISKLLQQVKALESNS